MYIPSLRKTFFLVLELVGSKSIMRHVFYMGINLPSIAVDLSIASFLRTTGEDTGGQFSLRTMGSGSEMYIITSSALQ